MTATYRPGVVRIWWAHRTDCRNGLFDLLDATERDRYRRYRRQVDADLFLLGAAVVRCLAGRHLGRPPAEVDVERGCRSCGEPHGKVRVPGSGLEFSVTHSGELVGVACHPGDPVGLDVEPYDRPVGLDGLLSQVLAPEEETAFARLDPDERATGFLRYWVRKEALVKTTGDGLGLALRDLVVSPPDRPAAVLRAPTSDYTGVRVYDVTAVPGYVGAVAVGRTEPVTVEELPAHRLLSP